MNLTTGYRKDSHQRWLTTDPDDDSMPDYLCEPLVEAYREEFRRETQKVVIEDGYNHFVKQSDVITKNTSSQEALIQIIVEENKRQDKDQDPRNTFWITVSGFKYEKTYIVYRFFCDIGPLVGKCFTKTNLMYLKYFSMLDCQIALSYNGQRIGYGGDISVNVKPENPVTESATIEALEQRLENTVSATETDSTSTLTVTIDVEKNKALNEVNPHKLETGQSESEDSDITHKRVSILQWLKEKLSYMFYFY